uniref:Chitin-binding type-2 domain-containing protein n=1 Tax=Photinus pyralis TaxID=7054 RepID=A0A1Y1LCW0_PHOPY
MKSSILAIVVAMLTTVADGYLDYRGLLSRAEANATCQDAGRLGLACSSCNEIGRCLCNSDGSNCTITGYQPCPAGRICKQGRCVVGSICTPEKPPEFLCSSPGMFPDPYDCKAYYFCAPCDGTVLKAVRVACGEDLATGTKYGYNPATYVCSNRLTNGECTTLPIPVCKRPFEMGVVGGNSNLYYTCLNVTVGNQMTSTLYPYQDACELGRRYNVATGTCA